MLLGVDPSRWAWFVPRTGRAIPGWDLTFRAPKSVSVLWGLADPGIARQVVDAHETAVAVALGYVEEHAGYTRTGHGGVNRVRADGLIAAGFRHRTSRDGDPHLHTHVLVANSVRAPTAGGARSTAAGCWPTCDRRLPLRRPAAPRAHRRLGVEWEPVVNGLADIAGIDDDIRRVFSKRRQAIEDRMAEWGHTSAEAAEVSALDTRRPKAGPVEHS